MQASTIASTTDGEPAVAGTSVLHFVEAMESLHGTRAIRTALDKLDPTYREQIETATPLAWVPAAILGAYVEALAEVIGISADRLSEEGTRIATMKSFGTVWRIFLRITTDEALISRTPLIYSKTRSVGRMSVDSYRRGHATLSLVGWPGITDRQLRSMAVSIETILTMTGRKHVACRTQTSSDGGRFDLTWGEPK
jgi:hypothetical protein